MQASKLLLGDAREILQTLPDNIAQCVWTDIPYPSLEQHREYGTTTRLKHSKSSSNEWFDVVSYDDIQDIAMELYRILENNTHAYSMTDFASMSIMKHAFEVAGFTCKQLITWDKGRRGMGYHYANQAEYILFFEKGERPLNTNDYTNVLRYAPIYAGTPGEKPIQLYTIPIKNSTKEGELVIDPFLGASGNLVKACIGLNRRYIGIEKKLSYFERARRVEERCLRDQVQAAPAIS